MAESRSEFRNDSGGMVGAVEIRDGKPHGISVRPNESVWLTEKEQIATANAPRSDGDNPFTNGTLVLITPATEVANRRPIGDPGDKHQVPQSEEQREEAAKRTAATKAKAEEAKKAEAERLAKAKKQAEQPATPVEETGASVTPSGRPTHGKRVRDEEVATPDAAAKADTETAGAAK